MSSEAAVLTLTECGEELVVVDCASPTLSIRCRRPRSV